MASDSRPDNELFFFFQFRVIHRLLTGSINAFKGRDDGLIDGFEFSMRKLDSHWNISERSWIQDGRPMLLLLLDAIDFRSIGLHRRLVMQRVSLSADGTGSAAS